MFIVLTGEILTTYCFSRKVHVSLHQKGWHLIYHLFGVNVSEPRHMISNNVVCATSKGYDQPAPTRSPIRAFASRLNIL